MTEPSGMMTTTMSCMRQWYGKGDDCDHRVDDGVMVLIMVRCIDTALIRESVGVEGGVVEVMSVWTEVMMVSWQ